MKINKLKINGYGKIKNKEINFENNINIVQGKNETGKSTMLSFISNMFYGASKSKNGKSISDFEKYKPWKTEEFSGKISYTLDNGENYEVYREFRKKNPIIYNKNLKNISNEFVVDKLNGINFLNEQIGIDENVFENTVVTYQDGIKMSKASQNTVIQKISNIVSSGDENVSFQKTIDKINKLQIEKIGTNRTSQKPINIIDSRIEELNKKKSELKNYKNLISEADSDITNLKKEIVVENEKIELLRKFRDYLENDKISYAEIDVNKEMERGYDDKIEELSNKIDKKAKTRIKKEKMSFFKNYITVVILTVLMILTIFLKLFIAMPIILGALTVLTIIVTFIKVNKFNSKKKSRLREIEELEKRINREIEILSKNKAERIEIIIKKENELNEKRKKENETLKNEYLEKLPKDFIQDVLDMNYDETTVAIHSKEDRLNELKLRLNTKETEKQVMNNKLDDLSKIEENLELALEERNELSSLNNSFNIAKECLEVAYQKIRESISPKFTNELCSLVKEVSNGKYKNVKFNDTNGLTVEIDDGRYIPAEALSIGTIDQMYLALRFSSLNAISKENMPMILDETFVYFDDERLKNILLFINRNYTDKQIIIFTCSNREKNILDKLKLQYNLIMLEN